MKQIYTMRRPGFNSYHDFKWSHKNVTSYLFKVTHL